MKCLGCITSVPELCELNVQPLTVRNPPSEAVILWCIAQFWEGEDERILRQPMDLVLVA